MANVTHEKSTLAFPDLRGNTVIIRGGGSGGLEWWYPGLSV
jgi:hypothetical protein